MALLGNENFRYEFDKTGESPDNLVANESHVLSDRQVRVFMPRNAHFYCDTFVMTDKATGRVVDRNAYFFEDVSETVALLTGLEAASIVVVTDRNVSKNVSVTYQAVGGNFTGADVRGLAQKIADLTLENRPVAWKNIQNKPTEFNPTPHKHNIFETFNYQHMVYVVERLVQATLLGDEASHDVIWDEINRIGTAQTALSNEFNTTKTQMGDQIEEVKQLAQSIANNVQNTLTQRIQALETKQNNHERARGNVHGLVLDDLKALGAAAKSEVDRAIAAVDTKVGNLAGTAATRVDLNNVNTALTRKLSEYITSNNSAVSTLRNTTYTKTESDAKDTKIRQYSDTQNDILEMAITKALTGKYRNGTENNPNVATGVGANGESITITDAMVNSEITKLFNRGIKLQQSTIPISTEPYNAIRWNKNGLYYGTAPEASTATLYVDPDIGVDEPVTLENKRGTRNKPLATFAYALSQGPEGVTRTILLAEGKTHYVSKKAIGVDTADNRFRYEALPEGHADIEMAVVRGGRVLVSIYGPHRDSLPTAAARGSTASFEEANYDEIHANTTKLVFRGCRADTVFVTSRVIDFSSVSMRNGATLDFRGITIRSEDVNGDWCNQILKTVPRSYARTISRFVYWEEGNFIYNGCRFEFGRTWRRHDKTEDEENVIHMVTDGAKVRVMILNRGIPGSPSVTNIESTGRGYVFYGNQNLGEGTLNIHNLVNGRNFLKYVGIGKSQTSVTGDDTVLFGGMSIKNGVWFPYAVSIDPPNNVVFSEYYRNERLKYGNTYVRTHRMVDSADIHSIDVVDYLAGETNARVTPLALKSDVTALRGEINSAVNTTLPQRINEIRTEVQSYNPVLFIYPKMHSWHSAAGVRRIDFWFDLPRQCAGMEITVTVRLDNVGHLGNSVHIYTELAGMSAMTYRDGRRGGSRGHGYHFNDIITIHRNWVGDFRGRVHGFVRANGADGLLPDSQGSILVELKGYPNVQFVDNRNS